MFNRACMIWTTVRSKLCDLTCMGIIPLWVSYSQYHESRRPCLSLTRVEAAEEVDTRDTALDCDVDKCRVSSRVLITMLGFP